MGTLAAGVSTALSLAAGQFIRIQSTGASGVGNLGPGPRRASSIQLQGGEQIGPFDSAQDVYLTCNSGTLAFNVGGGSVVTASRDLTPTDDGQVLDCINSVTLNVPPGLPSGFACTVIPASGTTISVSRGGSVLLNGASTTLTRAAASNFMFGIVARPNLLENYVVSGS